MAAVNVTFPGNLAQVKTANDLRSVPSTLLPLGALFLVNGLEGLFEYDPGSVAADDGKDVLRPYDKTPGQVGRWLRNVDGLATGPEGPTGPANSTYTTKAALIAAPAGNRSYLFAPSNGVSDGGLLAGTFFYRQGDFSGAAYAADVASGLIVQLTGTPLSTGALFRRDVSRGVDLDDFRLTTDADYGPAAIAASQYCASTGVTMRLRPKAYPGARIEVHGTFNVEGCGAKVDYLGVGTTIVGGSGTGFNAQPTPWEFDPNGYTVQMYSFTGGTKGSSVLTFDTVPNFKPGDTVFTSGEPAANSSDNNGPNFIPRKFEFARVKAVAGKQVTLQSALKEDYTDSKCRIFYTNGLAVNCSISGLTITTTNDAYQYVVRSAYGCSITDMRFEGNAAVGASTFTENLRCANWTVSGAYNGVSCARGTVSVFFDNIQWRQRAETPTAQFIAVFVEESCYEVVIDGMRATGGCFLIGSLNMSNPDGTLPATKRRVTLLNSVFDTRLVAGNSGTAPWQGGTATGVDIFTDNTLLAGVPTTPDPGQAPGITGAALTWLSSNAPGDTVTFGPGCTFISTGTVEAFKSGTAGLGQFLVSEQATYIGAVVPQARWTPRGAWASLVPQLDQSKTPATGGQYALPAIRRSPRGRDVVMAGEVNLVGVTDGYQLTQLPAFYRPASMKLIDFKGRLATGDGYAAVTVSATVDANGVIILRHVNGANVMSLDFSFPVDW